MIEYDFIILGAGGTGLAAAMYAARLGLKTLVLGASNSSELPIGGVITTTDIVENYPGFKKISGIELTKKLEEQARSYKLIAIKEEKALEIKKDKGCFYVKTGKGDYGAKAILFATGTKWKKLEVLGAKQFENRGVHYCALCDGPLFKNKIIAVVGGGDSAVKEAILLSMYAKKIYLIARSKIHPEPINLERLKHIKKIEVIEDMNIKEIRGEDVVKSILLDKSYKGKKEMKINGIFVSIGHLPLSELTKSLGVRLNERGEIKINFETTETNVKGIFAAGDITDKKFKQLITGVADGCTASYYAFEYITKKEVIC